MGLTEKAVEMATNRAKKQVGKATDRLKHVPDIAFKAAKVVAPEAIPAITAAQAGKKMLKAKDEAAKEQTKAATPETKPTSTEAPKTEVTKEKEMTFNQSQLDNIIKSRLDAESKKHQRQLDEVKKQDEEALQNKQVQEEINK